MSSHRGDDRRPAVVDATSRGRVSLSRARARCYKWAMSEKAEARVDPRDVGRMLGAATAVLRSELTALPPAALAWHPAPGEWCTKDVLGHLIEAERRGFAGRIRIILEHDQPMGRGRGLARTAGLRARRLRVARMSSRR